MLVIIGGNLVVTGNVKAELESKNKEKSIKDLIVKNDETSVLVNGEKLKIKNPVAGTDYVIVKKENKLKIKETLSVKDGESVVGGFHYGLIPHDFKAQNNISKKNAKKIRGINAYSIWNQEHRPVSDPSGMVYIKKLNIWVDIYLTNSEADKKGTSISSGTILAGYEGNKRKTLNEGREFKHEDFVKLGEQHNKRLLAKNEFQVAMDGVKENVSAEDLDNGTIQHIDFLTSKYGIEQAAGVQWVWSSEDGNYDEAKFVLGGYRDNGTHAGSRAARSYNYLWYAHWNFGSRFASDHMKPVYMSESE